MSFSLYDYTPSKVCAVIAVLLFLATTLYHCWLMVKHKTWFFTAFIIGGFFEVVGYIARALNASQSPNYTVSTYTVQSLLILLAPSLFAASIYMILGRIVALTDGNVRSPIRSKWMTKIFVLGDVLSFLIQCGGGGLLSMAKSTSALLLGNHVIVVGLIVQILFFLLFITVSITFHRRITLHPTSDSWGLTVPWKQYLWVLYAASTFILVRCVYRVVEYAQGSTGVLQEHEAYAYVFDTSLMLIINIIFLVYPPSRVLSQDYQAKDTINLTQEASYEHV